MICHFNLVVLHCYEFNPNCFCVCVLLYVVEIQDKSKSVDILKPSIYYVG